MSSDLSETLRQKFCVGDKLRWLGTRVPYDTGLQADKSVIVIREESSNGLEMCVQQGGVMAWRPKGEFEPWDKPESVTNAPDAAAAELEKIGLLLDLLYFEDATTTFERVQQLATNHIALSAERDIEKLEAIK